LNFPIISHLYNDEDEDEDEVGLDEDETKNLGWPKIFDLLQASKASSLPGNGAKNLTGQVLYLSKCTDHL